MDAGHQQRAAAAVSAIGSDREGARILHLSGYA